MKLIVYLISDGSSIGLIDIVKETMSHFNQSYEIKIFDRIINRENLTKLLTSITDSNSSIIYHSFRDSKMKAYVKNYLASRNLRKLV